MVYDWKKILRKERILFLLYLACIVLMCAFIFIPIVMPFVSESVSEIVLSISLVLFFLSFFGFFLLHTDKAYDFLSSQEEIGSDSYTKLKNMADKLEKTGYPEVKEEVQRLLKEQGKIEIYQFNKLEEHCIAFKEILQLQQAKQSLE